MNAAKHSLMLRGPAGLIEALLDTPAAGVHSRGLAVVCHPHPLHGGTMQNKVVQTLARAFVGLGYRCLRFNFRGIGASEGTWDEGRGEIDDALAAVHAQRAPGETLVIAGFSFGGYVASQTAASLLALPGDQRAERLVLVGPAVRNFSMAPVPEDTLVIHGEVDDVVPLSAVFDWARPTALPVTVLPGAGHFFHGQLPVLKHIVTSAWASRSPTSSS